MKTRTFCSQVALSLVEDTDIKTSIIQEHCKSTEVLQRKC